MTTGDLNMYERTHKQTKSDEIVTDPKNQPVNRYPIKRRDEGGREIIVVKPDVDYTRHVLRFLAQRVDDVCCFDEIDDEQATLFRFAD